MSNGNNETFADVAATLTAIADEQRWQPRRAQDATRRESARLDTLRASWAEANGVSVDSDPFAIFEGT